MYINVRKKIKSIINSELFSYIILLFLLTVTALCSTIINNLEMKYFLSFIFYQIVFIILPGISFNLVFKKSIVNAFFSYVIGYALSIILYFPSMILSIDYTLIRIISVCICLIPIILFSSNKYRNKNIKTETKTTAFISSSIFIVSMIIFLVSLILFNGNNLSPEITQGNYYNHDFMFYINNAVSATKGFPIETVSTSGNILFYHYFSSLAIADASLITKISVIDYVVCYSYITNAIMLAASTIFLLSGFIKRKAIILLVTVLILFNTGYENLSFINYVAHIYFNPFGYNIGVVFANMTIFAFIKGLKEKTINISSYIYFVLFFIICCGAKGPIAAVISGGIGITCLINLFGSIKSCFGKNQHPIIKKALKRDIIYFVSLLLIFFSIYLFVITDIKSLGSNDLLTMSLNFKGTISNIPILTNMYNANYYILGRLLTFVIVALYYLFISNPIMMILVIASIIHIYIKKSINLVEICLIFIMITGIILLLVIDQHGFSQMYFLMAVFPFAGMLIGIEMDEIKMNKWLFRLGSITIIFLCLFMFNNAFQEYKYSSFNKLLNHNGDSNEESTTSNYVSKETYEGLIWLKENSNTNDVIITNMNIDFNNSYVYSSISERYFYLEEYLLIDKGKVNINGRRNDILKYIQTNGKEKKNLIKNNVKYYIEFNFGNNKIVENKSNYIFQNEKMKIYKL
ncbi:MAG: hypothetical protein RSC93_04980 [Erysipelotrichaceae bacterium]